MRNPVPTVDQSSLAGMPVADQEAEQGMACHRDQACPDGGADAARLGAAS